MQQTQAMYKAEIIDSYKKYQNSYVIKDILLMKLVRSWDAIFMCICVYVYAFPAFVLPQTLIQGDCQMKSNGLRGPFMWHSASNTSCLALFYVIS